MIKTNHLGSKLTVSLRHATLSTLTSPLQNIPQGSAVEGIKQNYGFLTYPSSHDRPTHLYTVLAGQCSVFAWNYTDKRNARRPGISKSNRPIISSEGGGAEQPQTPRTKRDGPPGPKTVIIITQWEQSRVCTIVTAVLALCARVRGGGGSRKNNVSKKSGRWRCWWVAKLFDGVKFV